MGPETLQADAYAAAIIPCKFSSISQRILSQLARYQNINLRNQIAPVSDVGTVFLHGQAFDIAPTNTEAATNSNEEETCEKEGLAVGVLSLHLF